MRARVAAEALRVSCSKIPGSSPRAVIQVIRAPEVQHPRNRLEKGNRLVPIAVGLGRCLDDFPASGSAASIYPTYRSPHPFRRPNRGYLPDTGDRLQSHRSPSRRSESFDVGLLQSLRAIEQNPVGDRKVAQTTTTKATSFCTAPSS